MIWHHWNFFLNFFLLRLTFVGHKFFLTMNPSYLRWYITKFSCSSAVWPIASVNFLFHSCLQALAVFNSWNSKNLVCAQGENLNADKEIFKKKIYVRELGDFEIEQEGYTRNRNTETIIQSWGICASINHAL